QQLVVAPQVGRPARDLVRGGLDPPQVVAGQQRGPAGAGALHLVGVVPGAAARAVKVRQSRVRHQGSLCQGRQGGVLGSSALAVAWRIVPVPPIKAPRRYGTTPSISVSSEKLRNVLITTISPST